MKTIETIIDVNRAMRTWLQGIGGAGTLAVQPSDVGDTYEPRLQYVLNGFVQNNYPTNNVYGVVGEDDATVYYSAIRQHYVLTFQVDALYMQDNSGMIARVLQYFDSGLYRKFDNYLNLAYINSGTMRRIGYYKNESLIYKSTIDMEFALQLETVTDGNVMEQFNISACEESGITATINLPQ